MAAWRPTTYAELNADVRRIVDRVAERESARLGIPVERARELIARRVVTKSERGDHGTGH